MRNHLPCGVVFPHYIPLYASTTFKTIMILKCNNGLISKPKFIPKTYFSSQLQIIRYTKHRYMVHIKNVDLVIINYSGPFKTVFV